MIVCYGVLLSHTFVCLACSLESILMMFCFDMFDMFYMFVGCSVKIKKTSNTSPERPGTPRNISGRSLGLNPTYNGPVSISFKLCNDHFTD